MTVIKVFQAAFLFFFPFFFNVIVTDLVHHTNQTNQTQILFEFFSFFGDRGFLTLRLSVLCQEQNQTSILVNWS